MVAQLYEYSVITTLDRCIAEFAVLPECRELFWCALEDNSPRREDDDFRAHSGHIFDQMCRNQGQMLRTNLFQERTEGRALFRIQSDGGLIEE